MADNGNRGPNDSFRRSGRRRREPPIIEAAATEVPLDETVSEVSDPASVVPSTSVEDATPAGSESPTVTAVTESEHSSADAAAIEHGAVVSEAADEPVLFGSAVRDQSRREPAKDASSSMPGEEPSERPAADAVAPSDITRDVGSLDPAAIEPMPSASDAAEPPPSDPKPVMPPPRPAASNGLAGILGVAAVILLGIIGWLVYSGGQRGADAATAVADLKARVATLEARPDPAALQSQIAALDKRVASAETDRAALGKQVAALAARIDGAGQPAQEPAPGSSAPGATAPNTKPAGTAPAQPSPGPTLATAAAVAALATKVEAIDGRVTALSTEQTGTAKAVAALPKPVPPDFGPVNAKVAALETEVNGAVATMNGSDARLNGFDSKINGIDATVNGFGTTMNAMTARMNGLEGRIDDGAGATAKLTSDVLNLPKVDLGPLRASTAALDARLVKVETQLAAPKDGARVTEARAVGSADETKATPIALVGQAIERAIAIGKPYGPEIDALKALGADPALVARLGPASAGGAPSLDALTSQWDAARGSVLATMKPIAPSAGGTFNRFLAGATSIVQVRRVGEVAGEDTSALVSQIDAALGQGDAAAALAAWDKLPASGKAASQAWADAARSRVDAAGAAGDLVQGAIATLGRSPS